MSSENDNSFIAIRKGASKEASTYDIYFSGGNCPKYVGRTKPENDFIICEKGKGIVANSELNDFNKKI